MIFFQDVPLLPPMGRFLAVLPGRLSAGHDPAAGDTFCLTGFMGREN
jgi:hypothetical protein